MAQLVFLDFDLSIETDGDGYNARVLDSPAGQASARFQFPVDDWALESFLVSLGAARQRARRVESREMFAAKQLGGRLFNAVFGGEVRTCWQRCLDEARRRDCGLRIRLRLSAVPELAELPWEFLYDSVANQFLALSNRTPLVRYVDLPHGILPLAIKPPLRVLVMISNPADWNELDVDQERDKLEHALKHLTQSGLVVLEFSADATLEALQRRLRQNTFHLFHFIGHGGFDETHRDGLLVLCDENGRGRRVTSQRLGTILTDHSALRLVILNACEGARSAREDHFTGVAQTLMQKGIPAVIAMQYEVSDQVAIAFSQEFYAALVDGYPVDAAVSEARKTVYGQGNDVAWGIPVLYMRAPDGRIFDFDAQAAVPLRPRHLQKLSLAFAGLFILLLGCIALTATGIIPSWLRAAGMPLYAAFLSPTPTATLTATVTHSPTAMPTAMPSATMTATAMPTAAPSATMTATALPTTTPAPPTLTPTFSPTATRTALPTFTPSPTPTPTDSPTATSTSTPTRRPNTRTPTPPTPVLAPGIYLTALDIEPLNPLRNQQIHFSATLLNTHTTPQPYRLRFQMYAAETRKRYSDTALQEKRLAVGENKIIAEPWTYDSPLSGCLRFYLQLEYQTDAARVPFRDATGNVVARDFSVCAPEQ